MTSLPISAVKNCAGLRDLFRSANELPRVREDPLALELEID